MTALEFLSVRPAPATSFRPAPRSPLDRALAAGVRVGLDLTDLSLVLAKLEVRGDLAGITAADDLIRITPRRGLVLAPIAECESLETGLGQQGVTVVDLTGALAGLRIEAADAATLMRRLTDLDLEALPAVGAVARVPALLRGGGDSFELFWPQELGHHLVEVDRRHGRRFGKRASGEGHLPRAADVAARAAS